MFDWKIIGAILITMAVVLSAISTHPTVGNFFESVKDRLGGITGVFGTEENVTRGFSFSLGVDGYNNITTDSRRPLNISINSQRFSAIIKGGEIETKKQANIINYDGFVSVHNSVLILDGRFERIEFPDLTIKFEQGTIKSESFFNYLEIENLALKELKLRKVSGSLFVNNIETDITSRDIEITSPIGRFEFNNTLRIDGFADKISIPDAKIFIG